MVHYLASGASAFPKERIEGFFDGKTFVIDNWRKLRRYGLPSAGISLPKGMDKGHAAEVEQWMAAVREGGAPPIPFEEVMEVSRWAIRAAQLARTA